MSKSKRAPPIKQADPVFEKVFSRDFCLAAIELAIQSESDPKKPWYLEQPTHFPHLVAERREGTVNWHYHPQAWPWINRQLVQNVARNPDFLGLVEHKVLEGIEFIRPIYEKEEALSEHDLKRFIGEFRSAYPWIEAMWLLYRLEPSELKGDNSGIKKIRALTDKLSAGTDIVIRKSLAALYPKLGKFSALIRLSEIQSGEIPGLDELKARNSGYFAVNTELFMGLDQAKFEKRFGIRFESEILPSGQRELRGQSACKGIVRGFVRRVMGHDEIDQIRLGEIMVSPMTMVDFLPAMKKAAAIVTDEGGAMSHAAIVARELNKPCIVGTRVATQVFKDGDWVEVDATRGVVRLLPKQ